MGGCAVPNRGSRSDRNQTIISLHRTNNSDTKTSHYRAHKDLKCSPRPSDTEDFASHILRMEKTMRAHTESARLQLYKHQAAWWKSQYVAAQYENRMLRQLLDQIYQVPRTEDSVPRKLHYSTAQRTSVRSLKKKKKKKIKVKSSMVNEDDSDGMEFELSEEFMHFLDINRKHREERAREKARLKKERCSESETERVERMEQEPTNVNEHTRHEQLRMLYGESWKQVEGLETLVQMKYDQFCDKNKPAYWPNIPLNL